jgi:hypothetical protein
VSEYLKPRRDKIGRVTSASLKTSPVKIVWKIIICSKPASYFVKTPMKNKASPNSESPNVQLYTNWPKLRSWLLESLPKQPFRCRSATCNVEEVLVRY